MNVVESSSEKSLWGRRLFYVSVGTAVIWTLLSVFVYSNISFDTAEIAMSGREWQLGYYKHPPLIAWIYGALFWLSGSDQFWVLLVAGSVSITLTSYAIWRLSRHFLDDGTAFTAAVAANLVLFSINYLVNLEPFNHNTLLTPFVALATWSVYEALTTDRWRWWILLGASLGLGMMTKYEMALLAACIAGLVVTDRNARKTLFRAPIYVAMMIALLVFLPNLIWLLGNDPATSEYVQSRIEGSPGIGSHFAEPLIFLACQILPAIPALFLLLPGAKKDKQHEKRKLTSLQTRLLIWLGLGPFLFMMGLAAVSGSRLPPGWGIPFLSIVPLLVVVLFRSGPLVPSRNVFLRAAVVQFVLITAFVAVPFVGPRVDRSGLWITFPGRRVASEAERLWYTRSSEPLRRIGGDNWLSQNVAFYASDRPSVLCAPERKKGLRISYEIMCPWSSPDQVNRTGGMLVWYAETDEDATPKWLVQTFPKGEFMGKIAFNRQTSANFEPIIIGFTYVPSNAVAQE